MHCHQTRLFLTPSDIGTDIVTWLLLTFQSCSSFDFDKFRLPGFLFRPVASLADIVLSWLCVCVCLHVRRLSGHGLVKLLCQTLEYCWQPTVAQCLLESLRQLVANNDEYVSAANTVTFTLLVEQHTVFLPSPVQ